MPKSLATINVKFRADLKGFSTQMQNAQRKMKRFGKQMQRTGKNLSTYLTLPIAALGFTSVKAFNKQAQAIAQLNAGLKSTKGQVGFTSEALQKMANDLQNTTLFGDEEILKGATAQLLTFTNIAGEQFKRLQVVALDVSTRIGTDLTSASIMLGKALNDPIANLGALGRSGIQFSASQKKVIKALAATGRLAEAQRIILKELENQYGGSAAAAASAGTGPLKQLGNILSDLSEQFGKIIFDYLKPLIVKVKQMALAFKNLSPATKKIIVVVAALAAVVGPLMVAIGFMATSVIPGLITALTVLTGPVGLVVAALAAVAVVIYKNWAPIKKTLVDIANYFIDLYNESMVFRIAIQAIGLQFKNTFAIIKAGFKIIFDVLSAVVNNFVNQFKFLGKVIKAVLTGHFKDLPGIAKENAKNFKATFTDLVGDIGTDFKDLGTDITTNINNALKNIKNRKKIAIIITPQIGNATSDAKTSGGGAAAGRTSVSALPTIASADIKPFGNLDIQPLKDFGKQVKDIAGSIVVDVAALTTSIATSFGEMLGNLMSNPNAFQDFGQMLLQGLAGIIIQFGKLVIAAGVASEAFKNAIINPFGGGIQAIIAGIALVAIGTAMRNFSSGVSANATSNTTAFANGGIVYGPTNALVGEYAGARSNPEVIAPLDKLKSLMSSGNSNMNIHLTGEFKQRGTDMVLLFDKVVKQNNRKF